MQTPSHQTLDPDLCYAALCAKDSRFDGSFFVGVATTGIYCRPVCRVKTPRRASCTFYPNASAAEAAGFRPCLRCRPELAPYALQENLAYAIWQRIAAGALNGDAGMADLAAEVGLSTRQLQRLMREHFGVSPVELAQTTRLLFAKKLLQETAMGMTDIAHAAGFGSVRRFNALFASRYGMTPGSLRRGVLHDDIASGLITLRLSYRAPFAWEAMLDYLAGRAIRGVEAVQGQGTQRAYLRSVRLGSAERPVQGWLRVSQRAKERQLAVELSPGLSGELMPLLHRVRQQFDLDANPEVIAQHLYQDPLLARQMERTPGLRVPGAFDHFELAIRAVLGQQVSVAGANTLAARLVQQFGAAAEGPVDSITHHFPTPARLATATVDQIAALGLPGSRAATVQALSRFAAQGGLIQPPGASLEQVLQRLQQVPGIGDWTAQYIALRALRYPDAFPAGDLGLQKAAAPDSGTRLSATQLRERALPLSPWRGYAALLLWQSLSHP